MELERIALPPPGPRALPLALLELGCTGRFELLVGTPGVGEGPEPRSTLPQGLPPFAPPPPSQLQERFLGTPEWLPPHRHPRAPRSWQRSPLPRNLFALEPTPVGGGLRAERDPRSGALRGFTEELLAHVGLTPQNSLSLRRPPGPPRQDPRGGDSNSPFWPGGWDEPLPAPDGDEDDVDFEGELLTTPPGLKRGVEFGPPAEGGGGGGPLSLSSLLGTLDPFDLGEGVDIGGGGPKEDPKPREENVGGGHNPSPPPSPPPHRADSLEELLQVQPPPAAPPGPPPEEEQWAVPLDPDTPVENFRELLPEPAMEWPFPPDPFQQRAALSLERGHSLLVAAPTSAGKTAVAEYGIALARRHLTRAIYTSPIKALSNQKFRGFRGTFGGDVGLLTGDVQLHPQASCLIMTTEILRSMLYNGSDVLRDLEWAIFDEVHYINDPERGVVWEETLILLPDHVKLILLSATVPNALEFAQWVGRTKRRPVRVLVSRRRPVPLEHFLFPTPTPGAPRLFLVLDAQGGFSTRGYYAAVEAKKEQSSKQGQNFGAKQPTLGGSTPAQERGAWLALLGLLLARGLLPAVCFSFSRGRCDRTAAALGSLDLVTGPERSRIRGFVQRCLGRLRGSDRRLPQVLQVSEMLQRGIGVHHGGVLPLLKEMVEMLFSQGLVKVLFATETFAMGVNMPARTVVFESLRKHDGSGFRDLLPEEYVQMSGRAGRRGLDRTGTVIVLCRGALPELGDLHRVLQGRPQPLQSRFRLLNPSILQLLRAPALGVPELMRKSFGEFEQRRDTGAQQRRVAQLQQELAALGEPELGGVLADLPPYYRAVQGLRRARGELQRRLAESVGGLRAMAPGRVVVVCTPRHRNALGVVLRVSPEGPGRVFSTLVLCEKPPEDGGAPPPPEPPDIPYPEDLLLTRLFVPEGPCGPALEKLQPQDIVGVTARTLRVNPEKILQELRPRPHPRPSPHPSPEVGGALQELARLAASWGVPGGSPPPLLDPLGVLQLRDPPALEAAAELRGLSGALPGFRCPQSPQFPQRYSQFAARQRLLEELQQLQFRLSDRSLLLLPQYHQRLGVLRALGYVTAGDAVALGGRVAALLSSQELVLTELLLGGVLTPLGPEETLALLSCTLSPPRGDSPPGGESPPHLTEPLRKALEQLVAVGHRVGRLQEQWGVGPPEEEFVQELGFGLVQVVYEWARGVPFADIPLPPGLQEGSLVRCIQRLEERCRELRQAGRLLGDPALAAKMEAAAAMIRRDIVFAASLYTQ